MNDVIPALRITDLAGSKSFYIDGLGFSIEWEHRFREDFPVFVSIRCDSYVLYLTEHTGDCQPGGLVYLYTDDVDSWHKRLRLAGFSPPDPCDQPWKVRDMRVKDPSGNTICISTRPEGSQ